MTDAEIKVEYILRAKASLREDLRAKTWPEKVRAIEHMRRAARLAREGMSKTLAAIDQES